MSKKQMPKNKNRSTKAAFKNKVCRRCEIGCKSQKSDNITASLESSIKSHEIGNVLLPKGEKISLWERIKRYLRF